MGHVWQVIRLCLARICIWVDEKSVWPCWHFLLWHFSWILLLLYHEELKAMNFSLIHSLIIRLDFLADVYVLSDLLTLTKIFIHLDCMHLYAQMHDNWKKKIGTETRLLLIIPDSIYYTFKSLRYLFIALQFIAYSLIYVHKWRLQQHCFIWWRVTQCWFSSEEWKYE